MYVALDQEAVIRSAYEMPPLPQSSVRLAGIIASDEIELSDVVQVIECDPSLTLKLLKVANSVYSSSSRPIGTVKEAVIRLGTGAILGLAIGSCVQPTVEKIVPGYNLAGTDFWRHSLAAAMSTESVKSYSKTRISPLAFTSALLHDIGKVVLGHFLDEEVVSYLAQASKYGNNAQFRAEIEILSMHHGEIGGVVSQHWGLPETVTKGILFHHNPQSSEDPIAYITHFANYVAHEVAPVIPIGSTETDQNYNEDISSDLEYLGITESNLDKIFQMVRERLDAIASDYK